jgi:CubicO group peptidase (beta-lactamase class C family)
LFRIGSVSKLFVAVSVMQLVEKGQLDLQADINLYLDAFQVDNAFSTPITLEHLLAHTSGLQDPPYETTTDPMARVPLKQCLTTALMPPVTPPGEQFAYSSYGYALAAYVVEQVSGTPFDQYVLVNVLRPLGMHSSRYLLSPDQGAGLATGYFPKRRRYEPLPLDYDDDYPGGSLISTGHDMALFMEALLGGGCVGDRCILQPDTIAEMQIPRVRVPSGTLQQGLGFVVGEVGGERMLGHTGAIKGFGSSLDLYPDLNTGTFVAFNAECWESEACSIISELRQAFVAHMWPE